MVMVVGVHVVELMMVMMVVKVIIAHGGETDLI